MGGTWRAVLVVSIVKNHVPEESATPLESGYVEWSPNMVPESCRV